MKMDLERLGINYDIENQYFYNEEFKAKNAFLLPEQVSYCLDYASDLRNNNLPIIFNSSHLAEHLKNSTETNYSKKYLFFLAYNEDKLYKEFSIPKKRGGKRIILAPSYKLKNIQRWILDEILYKIPVHQSAKGFLKNTSIIDNAKKHTNQEIILNIDIKDFFPSIKFGRIYGVFKNMGYSEALSKLFTKLCTYTNFLPQGSPASPMISNLVCNRLDKRLYGFAEKHGFNYTRYADDITFSGDYNLEKYKDFIIKIIRSEGFRIAFNKLRVIGRGNAQVVTGLTTNEKVNFNRKKRRRLRAMIHNCKVKGPVEANITNDPKFRERLYGYTAFLKPLKPELSKKWKKTLDNIDWSEYDKKYGIVVDNQNLKGVYNERITPKYLLKLRNIQAFSEIPKLTELTPSEREEFSKKLTDLTEKCDIATAEKCGRCLATTYSESVHTCMKRIIGHFTGRTGGAHHGNELGDGWTQYIVKSKGKWTEEDKWIIFVMKSKRVTGKEKDTLQRQCSQYLEHEKVGGVYIILPSELDPNTLLLIAHEAESRGKKLGVITPSDLCCILKQYYDDQDLN